MTINDEMKIRELYNSKTDDELRTELERLNADPFGTFDFNNNDITHFNLKKVLKEVMGARDLPVPITSNTQNTSQFDPVPGQNSYGQSTSTPNIGKLLLGIVLFVVGVAVTMGSGGRVITYGLIIVGLVTIVQGFIGDSKEP